MENSGFGRVCSWTEELPQTFPSCLVSHPPTITNLLVFSHSECPEKCQVCWINIKMGHKSWEFCSMTGLLIGFPWAGTGLISSGGFFAAANPLCVFKISLFLLSLFLPVFCKPVWWGIAVAGKNNLGQREIWSNELIQKSHWGCSWIQSFPLFVSGF